jgi:ATP-dependent Zn protease
MMLAAWMLFLVAQFWRESTQVAAIPYSTFLVYQQAGRVADLMVGTDQITGSIVGPEEGQPERFRTTRVDPELADRLAEDGIEFSGAVESTWLQRVLAWVLPMALVLAIWIFLQRRLGQSRGLGGGIMSVGKNKAKIYVEEDVKISFEDVAGLAEAKEELKEIIGFLRQPERYRCVLLHQRQRVRGDVRRCRSGSRPRPVRAGARAGSMHHLHRRARRDGPCPWHGADGRWQRREGADPESAPFRARRI